MISCESYAITFNRDWDAINVNPPRNLEISKQTKRAKRACMALHCRPLVTHHTNRLCDVTSVSFSITRNNFSSPYFTYRIYVIKTYVTHCVGNGLGKRILVVKVCGE